MKLLHKLSPGRLLALGFLTVILVGSILLVLPISHQEGAEVSYLDALYTSTSAVCVTGLAVFDPGSTLSMFGQVVLCLLIQIGGLGVATVGAGLIIMVGRKISLRGRAFIKEGTNFSSVSGIIKFLRKALFITFTAEIIGAVLSFMVFARDFEPLKAIWLSVFHSIASFNNSGFDILGYGNNLYMYRDDVLLNLVTSLLIILGGIGYLVIIDVCKNKGNFRRFTMHTKVVISMTAILLVGGTVILKLTEGDNIFWLGAFFTSTSTRTAGFSTFQIGGFSEAGLLAMCFLMFVGASPGSTGGGIKTSTFFILLRGIMAESSENSIKAFRYSISRSMYYKASVITLLAMGVVFVGTFLLKIFDPMVPALESMFEVISAFGTVGLSTGISPDLSVGSKIVCIVVMYIGRLGPLTIASLWNRKHDERVSYPEGNLAIG
jgi:trk system potassium uptake protein TrkH